MAEILRESYPNFTLNNQLPFKINTPDKGNPEYIRGWVMPGFHGYVIVSPL